MTDGKPPEERDDPRLLYSIVWLVVFAAIIGSPLFVTRLALTALLMFVSAAILQEQWRG